LSHRGGLTGARGRGAVPARLRRRAASSGARLGRRKGPLAVPANPGRRTTSARCARASWSLSDTAVRRAAPSWDASLFARRVPERFDGFFQTRRHGAHGGNKERNLFGVNKKPGLGSLCSSLWGSTRISGLDLLRVLRVSVFRTIEAPKKAAVAAGPRAGLGEIRIRVSAAAARSGMTSREASSSPRGGSGAARYAKGHLKHGGTEGTEEIFLG